MYMFLCFLFPYSISVPVFFVLSSIFGGLCLLCSCACYFAVSTCTHSSCINTLSPTDELLYPKYINDNSFKAILY